MPNHLVSITRHRKAAAPSGKRSRANRARQFKPRNYPVTLARFKQVVIPNQTVARTRYCGSHVVTFAIGVVSRIAAGRALPLAKGTRLRSFCELTSRKLEVLEAARWAPLRLNHGFTEP